MAKFVEPEIKSTQNWNIALVVAEFNSKYTHKLRGDCVKKLHSLGISEENIAIFSAPGSFELPLLSKKVGSISEIDAVIAIGVVIRGGTPHFEYVCEAANSGLTKVALDIEKPVIFGVLTLDNEQQAIDRTGGKDGNKGEEFAVAAVQTLETIKKISQI